MRWLHSVAPKSIGRSEVEIDKGLIEKVSLRDRQAFVELYQRYHRRLARFLGRFMQRYDLTEEIINDTMFIVWCKAPDFRGDSQLSTWIMGIAYRRALKSLQRAAQMPLASFAAMPYEELRGASTEDAAAQSEWLEIALAELPLEQRMVLELTYFLGHSCEEIASIMDCPANTVKTRLFHARAKLRVRLPALAGLPPAPLKGDRC